jgi:uncharacterized protein (TIGR02268 family)
LQRIELSLAPNTSREICISPGLLTGFVFDAPVVVDLEEEIRFAEVTHGRTSINFLPPGDGVIGERLRLTARFLDGTSVTFVLVIHSGQASRQIEVYRDKRTKESYQHEVAQAHAKNQQLQQELERFRRQLEQLREECGEPSSMRRLIASRSMSQAGIRAKELTREFIGYSEGPLSVIRGITYRSDDRIAVEVWLLNLSMTPWIAVAASLVDAKGNELKGMQIWLEGGVIPPKESRLVVLEVEAGQNPQGDVTLVLRENGPRAITIPKVAVPR